MATATHARDRASLSWFEYKNMFKRETKLLDFNKKEICQEIFQGKSMNNDFSNGKYL